MSERKHDDRPTKSDARKPLADVRADADLMNTLTAAKGADNSSLAELKFRYDGLVYNELRRWNIRRCDVDDVASKVWCKVWRLSCEGKWNVNRRRHSADPFLPLLRKICFSKSMDFHRGGSKHRKRMERLEEAAKAFGQDWQDLAGEQSRRPRRERPEPAGVPDHLRPRVAALPDRLRTVYELHTQGLTNRSISTQVGCSWGEVSRRLKKAHEQLGIPRHRAGR